MREKKMEEEKHTHTHTVNEYRNTTQELTKPCKFIIICLICLFYLRLPESVYLMSASKTTHNHLISMVLQKFVL